MAPDLLNTRGKFYEVAVCVDLRRWKERIRAAPIADDSTSRITDLVHGI